jgi:tRNA (cytosine38-C5)-methyltransferase
MIGGLHRALDRSGINGSVVRAFDWDQMACQVYAANHGLIGDRPFASWIS